MNIKNLPTKEQKFLEDIFLKYNFSFQQKREISLIAIELNMWEEMGIISIFPFDLEKKYQAKKLTKEIVKYLKNHWQNLKNSPKKYNYTDTKKVKTHKFKILEKDKKSVGFGLCPVASPKTRCCNLLTLDAVESCGFDCSYCSIQSFYNENKIIFDSNFAQKLKDLEIDPNEIYHIGTGQSSDSLLWGDKFGVLSSLNQFAKENKNVILELKTKSKNIDFLLENEIAKNMIVTWSLNPQTIINAEEHLTASLNERIESAKKVAKKGIKVGFHFHPMVYYENYQKDYKDIFDKLLDNFTPNQIILISFGTLTFIKPVLKKIRNRDFKSKILQMPLIDAEGKFSYPESIKLEMFKFAYNCLKQWHKKTFFYLCMENHKLWKEVFGYEYPTNESFEMDMKLNYIDKIGYDRKKIFF